MKKKDKIEALSTEACPISGNVKTKNKKTKTKNKKQKQKWPSGAGGFWTYIRTHTTL